MMMQIQRFQIKSVPEYTRYEISSDTGKRKNSE
jgi:hypothetical protein